MSLIVSLAIYRAVPPQAADNGAEERDGHGGRSGRVRMPRYIRSNSIRPVVPTRSRCKWIVRQRYERRALRSHDSGKLTRTFLRFFFLFCFVFFCDCNPSVRSTV